MAGRIVIREFDYINQYYRKAFKRGLEVTYQGKPGKITGVSGPHVCVRLDGEKNAHPYHPTDIEAATEATPTVKTGEGGGDALD